MEKLLDLLTEKIADMEYEFRFALPARLEAIEDLEQKLEIPLPPSYKMFLQQHNGGFICSGHMGEYIWETGSESLPRDLSVSLFSLDELEERFQFYLEINWFIDQPDGSIASPIPFAKSYNNSCLFFLPQQDSQTESPVFDGGGFGNPPRGILFADFPHFLQTYIAKEGYVLNFEEQAERAMKRYQEAYLQFIPQRLQKGVASLTDSSEKFVTLDQWLKIHPEDVHVRCWFLQEIVRFKKWSMIVCGCSQILKQHPDHLWALALRRYALFRSYDDEAAFADGETITMLEAKNSMIDG